jgi:diguanylate cyclase (GGDEF)-like protein
VSEKDLIEQQNQHANLLKTSSPSEIFTSELPNKISLLFYRFTVPTLLFLFVMGIALIAAYINHQQSQLINSFAEQEEALYQTIIDNQLSHTSSQQVRSILTKNIFNQTQDGLQQTFIILAGSLGFYLLITIFIIRKLKANSEQLNSFVHQLKGMNNELHSEISKRDEMANQLEDLNGELKYQSLHDTLTKLPNRRLFEDRLNSTIIMSKRNKLIFAVMFLDLDGFKLINDTLGHDMGDELLKETALIFAKAVRGMDTVARLGGDEFAFILTDLDKPESAAYVAERVIKALETPIVIKSQQLNINTSIGITVYPNDGNSGQVLLKNADIAMYHAKNLGRGNFQFYREEMNMLGKRDLLLRNSLHNAL